MNDRKLLEAAAKAAGLELAKWDEASECMKHPFRSDVQESHLWNPLHDDGDALRLLVKLGLCVDAYPPYTFPPHSAVVKKRLVSDGSGQNNPTECVELYGSDPFSATRRAIVRAAAAMAA